jgi:hypothetical protein
VCSEAALPNRLAPILPRFPSGRRSSATSASSGSNGSPAASDMAQVTGRTPAQAQVCEHFFSFSSALGLWQSATVVCGGRNQLSDLHNLINNRWLADIGPALDEGGSVYFANSIEWLALITQQATHGVNRTKVRKVSQLFKCHV